MMRLLSFAFAGVAAAALLAVDRAPMASAADPELVGSWVFASVLPTGDSVVCIVKLESKDGKPSASALFSPPTTETTVTEFRVSDGTVHLTIKQVRTFPNGQQFASEYAFAGVRGKDAKVILGSTGDHRFRNRAKLTATDKEKLAANELFTAEAPPEPYAKVQQLNGKVNAAQNKVFREKDAEKRKELQKEVAAARAEAQEKRPGLLREVVEKHPDSRPALDAALTLLGASGQLKMAPEEAERLVKLAQKHATPYGPAFTAVTFTSVANALSSQKGLEGAALLAIEPSAKELAAGDSLALQFEVLSAYKFALEKAGKAAEAKALEPRIAKLDATLDAEYVKAVPPFKPKEYPGRNDTSASQVVVMELFTGAQCPPCVAADVAFDALIKSYKPTELVLIQYHMHIPGPDPLTNADTVARWDYYREEFPDDVRGTPSTLFNGKPLAGGGGGMSNAESKYTQYTGIINPMLEKSSAVKVSGKGRRTGDKTEIAVEVTGGDGNDMKLRLLVVEESVKYVGGNQLRFHHHVVRAMPGGPEGVAIKDKTFKHTATVDFVEVRQELAKYLDDYAANTRPFPRPDRPMDMKSVKVIALVQNDKTKEIAQAIQIEVEGKPAGSGE
jgi:hypothetical protein